jgi:hypothetical protein
MVSCQDTSSVNGRRHDQSPARGGKKVGPTARGTIGTKRSLLTDGGGIPIGLAVEGAKRNDFTRTRETLERIPVERPEPSPTAPRACGWTKGMTMT